MKTIATLLLLHSLGAIAQSPALKAALIEAPKPQPATYLQSDRSLILAEFAARITDVITTRQFMTNKCHCIHEVEIGPIANTTPRMLSFSVGVSAAINLGAYELYQHKHHKLARIALLSDIVGESVTNVNNEYLIRKLGK